MPSCARILMPTNSQLTITTHDLLVFTHDSVVTTAHPTVIDHYDSVAVFILHIRLVSIPLHHCFSVCLALPLPLSWQVFSGHFFYRTRRGGNPVFRIISSPTLRVFSGGFGDPQEAPKEVPRRSPKRPPKMIQEHPKRLQESQKRSQESPSLL